MARHIKIEKDVPFPTPEEKYGFIRKVINKMVIGDSIVLHDESEVNFARSVATSNGKKLKTISLQKGEGKRRVWLISGK